MELIWSNIALHSIQRAEVEVPECNCERTQFISTEADDARRINTRCPTLTNKLRGMNQKVVSYCMYGALDYYIGVRLHFMTLQ